MLVGTALVSYAPCHFALQRLGSMLALTSITVASMASA